MMHDKIIRYLFLKTSTAPTMVLFACCLFLGIGIAGAKSPNILLIVADDLGWNDIGYHNSEIRTPNLDELARNGVELDCHYVQPQCTPTRVALMTGRYPSRFGLHCCKASNELAFPFGTPTLASRLRAAGYATGMSGKWHLGSKPEWGPNHFGFEHSHGSLTGAVGMYDHRYRLDSPFATTWHRNHEFIKEEGHATDLTTKEAVRWIESHGNTDEPWFFYVPFHAVHTPLVENDANWLELNEHIQMPDRRLYAAAVSHMDDAVGKMVSALKQTGQLDSTLIIFTSDNGAQVDHGGNAYPPPDPKLHNFSSNAPLRGKKTQTFEGGFRVPAFVNWSGKLKPRKVGEPIHAVDWMPTLVNLVGESMDQQPTDGIDIWPLLTGEKLKLGPRTIYTVWGDKRQREALRHGPWKIVRNGGKRWSLYNLDDDPYETNDLRDTKQVRLQSLMEHYRAEQKKDRD